MPKPMVVHGRTTNTPSWHVAMGAKQDDSLRKADGISVVRGTIELCDLLQLWPRVALWLIVLGPINGLCGLRRDQGVGTMVSIGDNLEVG